MSNAKVRHVGSGENLAMKVARCAVSFQGLRLVGDPEMHLHKVVTEVQKRGIRQFRITFREPADRKKETVVVVHLEEDRSKLKLFRWATGWITVQSRFGRIRVCGTLEILWKGESPQPLVRWGQQGDLLMKGPLGKPRELLSW